jgi:tRNA pseudouridine38-40 synthase
MRDLASTLRMTVAYVGTPFSGWQVQRRGDTIQGLLESALGKILACPTRVAGAGRTDAGVHARAQVAHFEARLSRPIEDLLISLNSLLPKEIRVEKLTRARRGFHARLDARGKHYRYQLLTARKASPFEAPFVAGCSGPPPDLTLMCQGAEILLGRHDFAAFCGSGSAVKTTVRTIKRLDLARRRDTIMFDVEGDGFLRHQVRNVVGTLIEVGQGKRTPSSLKTVLLSKDRRQAGATAPAAGLCLMKVYYGKRQEV